VWEVVRSLRVPSTSDWKYGTVFSNQYNSTVIDAIEHTRYSETDSIRKAMAVKSIQLGQVWRNNTDGQDYLVTKVYSEVFTQYAVLRPAGISAPDAQTVKVKVIKNAGGAALQGYTFTQEGSF
jgi:hypothetical protein